MVSKQGSKVLSSPRSSRTGAGLSDDVLSSKKSAAWLRGGAKDLVPREKRGWAIALVFSVIYLFFLLSNKTPKFGYSSDGFCVTNFIPEEKKCLAQNSHLWAWREDAIFTVLAVVLGITTQAEGGTIVGVVAAILVHGLLHLHFAKNNCVLPMGQGGIGIIFANVAYGVFTAVISYLAIAMAGVGHALTVIGTIGVTFATVYLSQPAQGYGVSPIFMTTQLLVSLVGVTAKSGNPSLSTKMGHLFALPCLVSILELIFCCDGKEPGLFNKYGGHAWYDFFLHIAVLSTYYPDKPKIEE
jgi:hypothetical protein